MKPTRKRGSRYLKLVGNQMHKKKARNCSSYLTTRRGSQGQSLVEFALLIPILALILVGVFDLGRAFHALITIRNAGREAARYGTLHNSSNISGLLAAAVKEAEDSNIPLSSGDITVVCLATGAAPACPRDTTLQVHVNYTYSPLLSFFFPSGIPIHSTVEMRIP